MLRRSFLQAAGASAFTLPLRADSKEGIAASTARGSCEMPRVILTDQPVHRSLPRTPAPQAPAAFHDFFSEGDYWWDPIRKNPDGAYVQRDGT